jgi:hypothetical protein
MDERVKGVAATPRGLTVMQIEVEQEEHSSEMIWADNSSIR